MLHNKKGCPLCQDTPQNLDVFKYPRAGSMGTTRARRSACVSVRPLTRRPLPWGFLPWGFVDRLVAELVIPNAASSSSSSSSLETDRIARRVLGTAHPLTKGIEGDLQYARAALDARETPPSSGN